MRRYRTGLVLAALALAASFVAPVWAAGAAEAAGNPHRPTSNIASLKVTTESGGGVRGVDSFEGLMPDGVADDSQAEFFGGELTGEEALKLLEHQPMGSPLGAESVIGADGRVRVNPTTTFPYRAIGLITFFQKNGNFICSGWLINKNTVATAGHCVHGNGTGGTSRVWSTNVRFYPGRNGSTSPYGSCTAKSLHSVTGWTSSVNEQYDYGAIKLNCTVGNTTGWFGFWWQSASLTGLSETVSGYPGDKPSGQQWRSTGSVAATETRQVFYFNDTAGGMSGSPIFQPNRSGSFCSGSCSFGVHAYGLHGSGNHSNKNHGTRIVEAVFNNFIAWRNLP